WQRRDAEPEKKDIVVVDLATGQRVKNVARLAVNRAFGDLVFEPATVPGQYAVYYMPYRHEGPQHQFKTVYEPPSGDVDADWLARNLQAPEAFPVKAVDALPEAKVLAIEARSERDRMDPMEVVATSEEVETLKAAHPDAAVLLFPEDRLHAIRMRDDLPVRWIENGPGNQFHGEAERDEYYTWQVGIYAVRQDAAVTGVVFEPLTGPNGARIPAEAFTCFNTGGVDWLGQPFEKSIAIPNGEVQALWFGCQIPSDAAPGIYAGRLVLQTSGGDFPFELSLDVADAAVSEHGDNELWRQSRLRWLDSTIGLDDEVVAPYTPIKRDGDTIACLGRTVRFNDNSLVESIVCGGREVLARPIHMVAETVNVAGPWKSGTPVRGPVRETPGTIAWETVNDGDPVVVRGYTHMEFDGYINLRVSIEAKDSTAVNDLRLEIPIRKDVAKYMMGLGRKGGHRPAEWDYEWNIDRANNSFWIGDVDAGLHCKFKDEQDSWNLYNLRDPGLPDAWANGGHGGVSVREDGDTVLVTAFTGPRLLASGETLTFCFGLLPTPVKPLDNRHWSWRYYHSYVPIAEAVSAGTNIVNIHHGNEINPYINYPFIESDAMTAYVREAHDNGLKVKIYYTVRELSAFAAELWALRSLGTEIFTDGPGGGASWLNEHLVDRYAPAWHHPGLPNGEIDQSIATTSLSRWHNYYLEGLAWLMKHVEIDGLYLDGIGYNREIMQRVRKVMERTRPGSLIDFHSGNNFEPAYGLSNCANQYIEHFPYVDSLWFGEGFDYNESPDYWLVEISGIPFGLYGEMLQGGGNPWRGMVYGMTNRYGWGGDPRPLWKLWDTFGIQDATMRGYWDASCPVKTGREDVLATAYIKPGKALIALASWAPNPTECQLQIDPNTLGFNPKTIQAPTIEGLHTETTFA
ncbi:MAG: hypothetical protein QG656_934, partial [Candidatus Hydrogenedentes bacterium]|nr:hypothetical protein [Candidatus Hydrogenedentota bacterium]